MVESIGSNRDSPGFSNSIGPNDYEIGGEVQLNIFYIRLNIQFDIFMSDIIIIK